MTAKEDVFKNYARTAGINRVGPGQTRTSACSKCKALLGVHVLLSLEFSIGRDEIEPIKEKKKKRKEMAGPLTRGDQVSQAFHRSCPSEIGWSFVIAPEELCSEEGKERRRFLRKCHCLAEVGGCLRGERSGPTSQKQLRALVFCSRTSGLRTNARESPCAFFSCKIASAITCSCPQSTQIT